MLAERIGEYVSLGIDYFILMFNYGEEIEKMRFFIEEVRDKIWLSARDAPSHIFAELECARAIYLNS